MCVPSENHSSTIASVPHPDRPARRALECNPQDEHARRIAQSYLQFVARVPAVPEATSHEARP
jgi:hypothetical protein